MSNSPTPSQGISGKSRRIASNTLVLFVRMFLLTLINLYAVRLVLNGLGEEDYGIFNTVAGVITTGICVSSVLELSMQRFYSVAMGEHDTQRLQSIFSASIVIILILVALIILLLETVGLWFLNTHIVIPAARMATTQWVYQFATASFVLSILQIPFTSAIFAHEEMGLYALVSTIDCLLKLSVAILINHIAEDHLMVYSAGLMLTALITCLSYSFIGRCRYQECRLKLTKDKKLYKGLLFFSGWALYGSIASVGLIQGSTILLNVFFGPVIVAAFAVSLQINNAFVTLCNSIVMAFRPAMIKAYAEKNFGYLNKLFSISNKIILYGLAIVAIPLFTEMDTILRWWLVNVSTQTILFARLVIIYALCLALNNPISIIMHASGHIKEYNLPVETITIMCVPVSWILFFFGNPAHFIFLSMTGVCLIAHIIRLICLHFFYRNLSVRKYLRSFLLPATIILCCCITITYILHTSLSSTMWRLPVIFVASPIICTLLTYCFGFNQEERFTLKNIIKYRS